MIKIVRKARRQELEIEQIDREDILGNHYLFQSQFKGSYEDIFGDILFSEKRLHLYIYKVYKRDQKGYYLAKWILDKFIDLLVEDLIYENDRFQFPRKKIFLSVKDANESRIKKWFVPSRYGKDYRLFIEKEDRPFFCRLAKPWYKKILKHGDKHPYL